MKFLKIFGLLCLAIVYSVTAYSEQSSNVEYFEFPDGSEQVIFSEWYLAFDRNDIRSKALNIMKMIDENDNKSKEKTLSILLEVELNILKDKINKRIKQSENSVLELKKEICRDNNANQNQMKSMLDSIEGEEKTIQLLKNALQLAKQWKRDYCN
jgi:hypothetical protein